jgi:dienelactone hydrolase
MNPAKVMSMRILRTVFVLSILSLAVGLATGCQSGEPLPLQDGSPSPDSMTASVDGGPLGDIATADVVPADSTTPNPDSQTQPTDGGAGGPSVYRLTVKNGFGSGDYRVGQTVHIFADLDTRNQAAMGWTGDVAPLVEPHEWHTTLVMPARDVTVQATIQAVGPTLHIASVPAAVDRKRKKTVRYYLPTNPRGLVGLFHGTGGSSLIIEKTEGRAIALRLVAAGYAVFAGDAEEVDLGDQDGNQKIRWLSSVLDLSKNHDMQNIRAIVDWFKTQKGLPQTAPFYAIGMSNGGAFSVALGAAMTIDGAASFCASGSAAAAKTTQTPTIWLMCENDTNEQVDNAKAKSNHDALVKRGVRSDYRVHPPSPLFDQRFARISDISLSQAKSLADELRAAGFVDQGGFINASADAIATQAQSQPASLPTLTGLKGGLQKQVLAQLKVLIADHQLYSDWTAHTLRFFEHP